MGVCACACVCLCVYVYVYVYVYVHVYVYVYVHYVHVHVYVYAYVYVSLLCGFFLLVNDNLGLRTQPPGHGPRVTRPRTSLDPPPANLPKTPEDAFFVDFLCFFFAIIF